jgi:alkanesulfonate monooxygenase SsuD/methylene tetrahydromethanopterin reductase-like flavin-dependent oxidoreductase (luciferase family)
MRPQEERDVKFSAQVNCYRTQWDDIRSVLEVMDAGRWHGVYHADHFVPPNAPRTDEPLTAYEGYTAIAAAAAITETLELGHLVLGNTYRNPALVAKMAGTIDHISHGRFTVAIGAGWFKREHEAYGWTFPELRERSDRLEEAAAMLRSLFTANGEPVDFAGKYYQLDQAPFSPGGFEGRQIPIMIGGTGERRTLRTLAMYGDVLNVDGYAGRGMSVELYREKVAVLNRHCEKVGRDPSEIRHTLLIPTRLSDEQADADEFIELIGPNTVAGNADYIVQRLGEFAEAGVEEVMFGRIPNTAEDFQRFEDDVIAAFD